MARLAWRGQQVALMWPGVESLSHTLWPRCVSLTVKRAMRSVKPWAQCLIQHFLLFQVIAEKQTVHCIHTAFFFKHNLSTICQLSNLLSVFGCRFHCSHLYLTAKMICSVGRASGENNETAALQSQHQN